jgi:hypothetical protein
VAGVPVAVVIEAASFLEHAMQLDAARPHIFDVSLGRFVAVFEAPLLLRLAPKDLVVAVRVERRVDVNQIDAGGGQLSQLVEVIPSVDNTRINDGGGFRSGHWREDKSTAQFVNALNSSSLRKQIIGGGHPEIFLLPNRRESA